MRLSLADGVHGALLDGDLVLLDVESDSYFCLPAGDQTLALRGRQLDAEPEPLASALCQAGLARRAKDHDEAIFQKAIRPPLRTARALLETASPTNSSPLRWRHLAAIARALGLVAIPRKRAFADRLKPAATGEPRLSADLLGDLAIYRRWLPWLPVDGACMFRSEMLRAYLRALGHDAIWMFGVRVWPFGAHCWLQVEDVALDDEAERLIAYHPIMAV